MFGAYDNSLFTQNLQHKLTAGSPAMAGSLIFSDLVFDGDGNDLFKAFEATNGKMLWKYQCGAGVNAPAVLYTVNGKQYFTVAAGGYIQLDFKRGNSVFVLAL